MKQQGFSILFLRNTFIVLNIDHPNLHSIFIIPILRGFFCLQPKKRRFTSEEVKRKFSTPIKP